MLERVDSNVQKKYTNDNLKFARYRVANIVNRLIMFE